MVEDVTTCITLSWHGQRGGGIENENEAEDWSFRTVSCYTSVAQATALVPNPTDDYF